MAESSNKSLSRIIKKLLDENKKSWDTKLKFSLWADRVTNKKSIGTSPFKLVYGTEAIFPVHLSLSVARFLQEAYFEPDDHTRKIFQLVELQQEREGLLEKTNIHQKRMKDTFDRKVKTKIFKEGNLVLKWDATRQDKGKHGKFNALWMRPFIIAKVQHNNTFILHHLDGEELAGGPFNG